MTRSIAMSAALACSISAAAISLDAQSRARSQPPPAVAAPHLFEVYEQSIVELQDAMTAGRVTSKGLVDSYLARIAAYDQAGPQLNAIVMLNPRAREDAEALDRERAAKGPRGPLHGIPVLVKDNYDIAEMPTAAGSLGLATLRPAGDAFQVRKLREAGAVILGKTTMHELAAGITTDLIADRTDQEPVRPGPRSRRIERRHRRGRWRQLRRSRHGQRYVRIDQDSRSESESRRSARNTRALEPDWRCPAVVHARCRRPAGPFCHRPGDHVGCDRRSGRG
jgi:hypothetical protein